MNPVILVGLISIFGLMFAYFRKVILTYSILKHSKNFKYYGVPYLEFIVRGLHYNINQELNFWIHIPVYYEIKNLNSEWRPKGMKLNNYLLLLFFCVLIGTIIYSVIYET